MYSEARKYSARPEEQKRCQEPFYWLIPNKFRMVQKPFAGSSLTMLVLWSAETLKSGAQKEMFLSLRFLAHNLRLLGHDTSISG